jgi:hypothetical protein
VTHVLVTLFKAATFLVLVYFSHDAACRTSESIEKDPLGRTSEQLKQVDRYLRQVRWAFDSNLITGAKGFENKFGFQFANPRSNMPRDIAHLKVTDELLEQRWQKKPQKGLIGLVDCPPANGKPLGCDALTLFTPLWHDSKPMALRADVERVFGDLGTPEVRGTDEYLRVQTLVYTQNIKGGRKTVEIEMFKDRPYGKWIQIVWHLKISVWRFESDAKNRDRFLEDLKRSYTSGSKAVAAQIEERFGFRMDTRDFSVQRARQPFSVGLAERPNSSFIGWSGTLDCKTQGKEQRCVDLSMVASFPYKSLPISQTDVAKVFGPLPKPEIGTVNSDCGGFKCDSQKRFIRLFDKTGKSSSELLFVLLPSDEVESKHTGSRIILKF